MARVLPAATKTKPSSEGPAELWEIIDGLATRRGVTTQEIADSAEVTWAAAKRWRLPREKGGAEPKAEQIVGIARALRVTVDELLRHHDDYEPPFDSWKAFSETETYKKLTSEERRRINATAWPESAEPSLGSWLTIAEAFTSARKRG